MIENMRGAVPGGTPTGCHFQKSTARMSEVGCSKRQADANTVRKGNPHRTLIAAVFGLGRRAVNLGWAGYVAEQRPGCVLLLVEEQRGDGVDGRVSAPFECGGGRVAVEVH